MNYLAQSPTDERFVLNLGPQHPATHGVLRVKMVMDGEYIVEAEPVLGYIHRIVVIAGSSFIADISSVGYCEISRKQDVLQSLLQLKVITLAV